MNPGKSTSPAEWLKVIAGLALATATVAGYAG
jgi:hypothetical protein